MRIIEVPIIAKLIKYRRPELPEGAFFVFWIGFCDFLYIFAVAFERMFELWCNGNTADFGSVVLGSSPGSSTTAAVVDAVAKAARLNKNGCGNAFAQVTASVFIVSPKAYAAT